VTGVITPITPDWAGETCFILGGGPSLTGFSTEILRGRGRVLAINNSYRLCPWADLLYFSDRCWYGWHHEHLSSFKGRMVTVSEVEGDGIKNLTLWPGDGLELRADRLRGNNGGYHAINLAFHLGVKRIVLLGYDMRCDNGKSHFHEGHPDNISLAYRDSLLKEQVMPQFRTLVAPLREAGVEVVNANQGSYLNCWPLVSLESQLPMVIKW
jgi:hypothetical protein